MSWVWGAANHSSDYRILKTQNDPLYLKCSHCASSRAPSPGRLGGLGLHRFQGIWGAKPGTVKAFLREKWPPCLGIPSALSAGAKASRCRLGGGHGLSSLLSGIKDYPHVQRLGQWREDGGSSGELRKDMGVLPRGISATAWQHFPTKRPLHPRCFSTASVQDGAEGHTLGICSYRASEITGHSKRSGGIGSGFGKLRSRCPPRKRATHTGATSRYREMV